MAAGIGSGGRLYDDDARLGKRLVHEEGVALVREWIAAMPDPSRGSGREPR